MKYFILYALCTFFSLFLQDGLTLRCYPINQQYDEQFDKVIRKCNKRLTMKQNTDNTDFSSNESNISDESSNSKENIFDRKLFPKGNTKLASDQNQNKGKSVQSAGYDNIQSERPNYANGRLGDAQGYDYTIDNEGSMIRNWTKMKSNGDNRADQDWDNDERRESCIVHCCFDELNVVDQQGFPKQESLIQLLTQTNYDPELRDFVEESVRECFQFLNSNTRKEKCDFSKNLFLCLANKGRERCEDWNM